MPATSCVPVAKPTVDFSEAPIGRLLLRRMAAIMQAIRARGQPATAAAMGMAIALLGTGPVGMGMEQMDMEQMDMGQMGMEQMGMEQMDMEQMGMEQMGMEQMGMGQMGMGMA
jgi:hypothetical protein